jgi:hypothetical protein
MLCLKLHNTEKSRDGGWKEKRLEKVESIINISCVLREFLFDNKIFFKYYSDILGKMEAAYENDPGYKKGSQ